MRHLTRQPDARYRSRDKAHARYRTLPADSVTVITAGRGDFRQPGTVLPGASLRTGPRLRLMPSLSPAESPIGLAPAYSSPKGRPVSCSHIVDGRRGRRSRAESDRWPKGGVRFASTSSRLLRANSKGHVWTVWQTRQNRAKAARPVTAGHSQSVGSSFPRPALGCIDGYRGLVAGPWSLSI